MALALGISVTIADTTGALASFQRLSICFAEILQRLYVAGMPGDLATAISTFVADCQSSLHRIAYRCIGSS